MIPTQNHTKPYTHMYTIQNVQNPTVHLLLFFLRGKSHALLGFPGAGRKAEGLLGSRLGSAGCPTGAGRIQHALWVQDGRMGATLDGSTLATAGVGMMPKLSSRMLGRLNSGLGCMMLHCLCSHVFSK